MKREKTGGRAPGVKNHKTAELKTWVKNLLETNQTQFEADLKALKASERVQIYERLLKYAIAPLQALSPEAAIQYEYLELKKLLDEASPDAIQKISDKIMYLKAQNENG